jgi:hypothetical protein
MILLDLTLCTANPKDEAFSSFPRLFLDDLLDLIDFEDFLSSFISFLV